MRSHVGARSVSQHWCPCQSNVYVFRCVLLCCAVLCRVVSCRVVSCRVVSCRVASPRVCHHYCHHYCYHGVFWGRGAAIDAPQQQPQPQPPSRTPLAPPMWMATATCLRAASGRWVSMYMRSGLVHYIRKRSNWGSQIPYPNTYNDVLNHSKSIIYLRTCMHARDQSPRARKTT